MQPLYLYLDDMAKILIMVRTSTEAQSIETQHKEMEEFCIREGYAKEDIVWVEEEGASASRVDDAYREMIDKVKECVEKDPEINCFAVWHLNRLARTEEVWIEVKRFFVSRKIQILCKTPYLKLLTPNGDIDPGMELAMGLMAILAKQDNDERKAKFKRAKTAMLAKGQYIGGNVIPFGYKVVDKSFVEDEEQGQVVKTIYKLYSTGEYSSYTLSKELDERGIKVTDRAIIRILKNKAYIGEDISENGMHYPAIVSKELWDKCAEVRSGNKIEMKRGERLVLGAKLVRCYKCGAVCTSNSKHYVCCRAAAHGECDNRFALRQYVADELLWRVAQQIHLDYLLDLSENEAEEYKKTLEVLDEKVKAHMVGIKKEEAKKERVAESYIEGSITKEKQRKLLLKIESDIRSHFDAINSLVERMDAIEEMLNKAGKSYEEAFVEAIEELDLANKFDVVHRHIKSLVAKQVSFGHRDPRTTRPNGVEIIITSKIGKVWKFMYVPKLLDGHNLYVWNGKKWVGDYVTPPSQT